MDLREVPSQPGRRHPWEVSRARFFTKILGDAGWLARTSSILDAGAGDTWLSRQLWAASGATRLVCWDAHYGPDAHHTLDIDDSRIELTTTRPPGEQFDLVLALDVLEHVADDGGLLGDLVTDNLAPGGHLLVSVPAWPALMSRHDRALGHHRRYTPARLRHLARAAGLDIVTAGSLFHSLLAPRAAAVVHERLTAPPHEDRPPAPQTLDWHHHPVVTAAVSWALAADNLLSRLAARGRLPLPGLSTWALCRR